MKAIRHLFAPLAGAIALLAAGTSVHATSLNWKGYTWTISPYAIGSGIVSGNTADAFVDSSGYLHLELANIGGKWYGGEVATVNNFGFGHFYWVFNAPIQTMEHQDVLAGFTYGPQNGLGKSGQNEIDVEFSHWNNASWWPVADNCDFAIYPSPQKKGKAGHVETDFAYRGTNLVTCRIDWSATSITESLWSGVVSPTASTSTAANTWTYNNTDGVTIPQSACPFLFNIWTYGIAPTQPVDAVVQDFSYSP